MRVQGRQGEALPGVVVVDLLARQSSLFADLIVGAEKSGRRQYLRPSYRVRNRRLGRRETQARGRQNHNNLSRNRPVHLIGEKIMRLRMFASTSLCAVLAGGAMALSL